MLNTKAVKLKSQAYFLFFVNKTHEIIKNGFANQEIAAPPANIASQPIKKASIDVLHPLFVQNEILKREKKKSPTPIIKITDFIFDFSTTNICSSSENGIL